jgi:hypothetical protein
VWNLQLATTHITFQEYEHQRSWLQWVSKLQDLCPGHYQFDLNLGIAIFSCVDFVMKWLTNCIFQLAHFWYSHMRVFVCMCTRSHNSGVTCDPVSYCFLLGAKCFLWKGGWYSAMYQKLLSKIRLPEVQDLSTTALPTCSKRFHIMINCLWY